MNGGYRRGGLVWPVLLLGLGLVLLLNNLGILSWSVWDAMLRMWPLLLIAIGLDLMIGRRSVWGGLLSLVLILAVFVGGFFLSGARIVPPGQSLPTEAVRQPLGEAKTAQIVLAPAAGVVRVHALSGGDLLVEGSVPAASGERIVRSASTSGTLAHFELRSTGTSVFPFYGRSETRVWTLGLTPAIPIDLDVKMGAGQAELDLTGLTLSRLRVEAAVGQTIVTLPARGRFQGKITGAIGETVIIVPKGVAVRLHVSSGIAGVQMPGGKVFLGLGGDEYVTPGFDQAADRVEIEVSQAIGSIVIR